jgi:hypothetical protein
MFFCFILWLEREKLMFSFLWRNRNTSQYKTSTHSCHSTHETRSSHCCSRTSLNSLSLSLTHSLSFYLILSHSQLLYLTLSHSISFYLILSHSQLLYLTLSHSISLFLILSHSLVLTNSLFFNIFTLLWVLTLFWMFSFCMNEDLQNDNATSYFISTHTFCYFNAYSTNTCRSSTTNLYRYHCSCLFTPLSSFCFLWLLSIWLFIWVFR